MSNRKSISLLRVMLMAGASAASFCSLPAFAQTVADNSIEQVTVTARNREEKLQDVPLSITAVSADQLAESNTKNIRDLSYLTPGVTVNDGGAEYGTAVVIRGLSNLSGGASDPNVAVFLDGVYQQNTSAISLSLLDVERIEVVKGPVSATYGRSAYAGAINYVTRGASQDFVAHATAQGGSDGLGEIRGAIGGGVIPGLLALKLAAGYSSFGGSYTDQVNGRSAGGYNKNDVQGSFLFTPAETFTIKGSIYYGSDKFAQTAKVYNINNCGPAPAAGTLFSPGDGNFTRLCGEFNPSAQPVEVPAINPAAGLAGNNRKVAAGNVTMNWDVGFADVVSITGINSVYENRLDDFIGRRAGIPIVINTAAGAVDVANGSTRNFLETFGQSLTNQDQSEEIRLVSKQDQRFRWAVGGYYFNSIQQNFIRLSLDASTTTNTATGAPSPIPAGDTVGPGGFYQSLVTANGTFAPNQVTHERFRDRELSGFISADYDILPELTASGELRYSEQKKDSLLYSQIFASQNFPNGGVGSALGNPKRKDSFINYRASLKYTFMPGVMGYISVANGTKGGGFNPTVASLATPGNAYALSFGPEKNVTYEAGFKTSWLDNRLQLNATGYHIDVKNVQISGPALSSTGTPIITVTNFGAVHDSGFEFEGIAIPFQGVDVRAGLGYSDPRFGNNSYDFSGGDLSACAVIASCSPKIGTYTNPILGTLIPAIKLAGTRIPRTSQTQFTLGIGYQTPLESLNGLASMDGWRFVSHFDYRNESNQVGEVSGFYTVGARTNLNLRVGIENNHVSLAGFVTNLTNDMTPDVTSQQGRLGSNSDYAGYLPNGRIFGVELGYTY